LQEHTYSLRALQVREILHQSSPGVLNARHRDLYRQLA